MARLIGPSEASREVKTIVSTSGVTKGLFKSKALRPATYYTTSAATALADVLNLDDSPILDSTVTIDSYSMLPLMQFPDGVDVVYVRVDGGPAWPVYAREDDRLDALNTAVQAAQSTATGALAKSSNLADVPSPSTARTNLGLGSAATKDVGTTPVDVAAGDAPATAQAAAVQRANHTGTQSADTLTDGTTNKAFLATERTKLAGIATGATANATDAQLRDRSTHTGTQAISTVTGLQTVLDAKAPAVLLLGAGIDYTGVSDSTTAMQAAINAAPDGSDVVALPGFLKFSNLSLTGAKRLRGTYWWSRRDSLTTFGDSNYQNATYFGGTVLRSTATTGSAITVSTSTANVQSSLADFVLVGPGTGTSVGITIGSSSRAILASPFKNVGVYNFDTGWVTKNFEECTTENLSARGCNTAFKFLESTNNNVFNLLNFQRCGDGVVDDNTAIANVFLNPIGQGNTGTGIALNGNAEIIEGGYFEDNSGVRAIDVVQGKGNQIVGVQLTWPVDGIRVQAAAHATIISNPVTSGPVTITNAGVGTLYVGETGVSGITFTDTGTATSKHDLGTSSLTLAGSMTASASLNTAGKVSSSGVAVAAGSVVANLLSAQQASYETVGGWSVNAKVTLAQNSTQAVVGTKSLQATVTDTSAPNSGNAPSAIATVTGITASTQYTFAASTKALDAAQTIRAAIYWRDAGGSIIGVGVFGTGVTSTTTGWTRFSITATSPVNAASCFLALFIYSAGGTVGDKHVFDAMQFNTGTNTNYTDPGGNPPAVEILSAIPATPPANNGIYLYLDSGQLKAMRGDGTTVALA